MSFFLNLLRLFSALWYGLKVDPEFRILLATLSMLLVGSVLFYTQEEGWSIVDALYFSVMTMSTIGYGDLTPTTVTSKIFTIVFAVLSIGVFVAIVTKIVSIVLERQKQRHRKKENGKSEVSNTPTEN